MTFDELRRQAVQQPGTAENRLELVPHDSALRTKLTGVGRGTVLEGKIPGVLLTPAHRMPLTSDLHQHVLRFQHPGRRGPFGRVGGIRRNWRSLEATRVAVLDKNIDRAKKHRSRRAFGSVEPR